MATIDDLIKKLDDVHSSTETTEGILAEVLDKLNEVQKSIQTNNVENPIEIETLNKLAALERTLQLVLENKPLLSELQALKLQLEKWFSKPQEAAKNIVVFGGQNAVVRYHQILIGLAIIVLVKLGFDYIPNYLIQKQQLEQEFVVYKAYAELHQLNEFFKTKSTQHYDSLIESIKRQSNEFKTEQQKLIEFWNKEHEKVVLEQQIEQNKQRLKELEK